MIRVITLLLISLCSCFSITASAKKAGLPNVVIFMADDFGLGSSGPYGANPELVRTPALDRLARSGLTFDQAYVTASVCSPTRYTMLTGRYSWRTRLKAGVINSMDPLLIDPKRPTIASWLKKSGYQTAHVGKWHLGHKSERFKNLLGDISPGANDVGFEYHFSVPNNFDDVHKVYIENDRIYGLRSDKISPYGKSFYGRPYAGYDAPQRNEVMVMETLTGKAIEWIDQCDPDRPIFLYFASVAVHHPIMPSERMRGTSEAGAYGDFIHDVDYAVGRLMDAFEHRGIIENTIFIFTSDNGGDLPKDEARPERQAANAGLDVNGGMRGDKHQIYEGGLRVPFIISWPNSIDPGNRSNAFVTTGDLFATLSEIITGKVPKPDVAAPDSFSFAEVLSNPEAESTRPHGVFRDARGRKAMRKGDWKYVDNSYPNGAGKKGEIELYNLRDYPVETKNLAGTHPEIVESAKKLLEAIENAPASRSLD